MIATLPAVAGIEHTSQAFRRALIAMAERLKMDPDAIAAVMSFETAHTFSPAKRNPDSGAVGLIQFDERAAEVLGTTQDELAEMSGVTQMAYVERFFELSVGGRPLNSLSDYYMAVFKPPAIGRPEEFPLYSAPSKAYEQNRALDASDDGVITKAEAAAPVVRILEAAGDRRVPVRSAASAIVGGAVLLSVVGLGLWALNSRW